MHDPGVDTGTIIGETPSFVKGFFIPTARNRLARGAYLYYSIVAPMKTPTNILIIKPGAIGDLLQLTPVVRALRTQYPSAAVTVLVGSAASASLFRNNPLVERTMVYDRRGAHRSLLALLGIWNTVRKTRFDLVLNFQRSNLKAWFLVSAALPCRILVYHKSDRPGLHAVDNYLQTLVPLGITSDRRGLELYPGPEDRAHAERLLGSRNADNRPVVALNPGASHIVNRWPLEQFSILANRLGEELNALVIIIGGAEDADLAEKIAGAVSPRPLVLSGRLTLLQLGAVLERCAALVTGDTGPMHVATAVGTRVIALFGAADPGRTGPVGTGHIVIQSKRVDCVPCRSRTCAYRVHLECMRSISPQEVLEAVRSVLRGRGSI